MKKLIIVALFFIESLFIIHAESPKKRINAFEKKVAFLARTEEKAWQEILKIHHAVTQLEKNQIKKLFNQSCRQKKETPSVAS